MEDNRSLSKLPTEDDFFAKLHETVLLPDGRSTTDPAHCDLCDGDYHPGGALWQAVEDLPVDADSGCILVKLPCGCLWSDKRLVHLLKTTGLASCPHDNEEKGCNKALYFRKYTFKPLFESYLNVNPVLRPVGGAAILPWEPNEEELRIRKLDGQLKWMLGTWDKEGVEDKTDEYHSRRYHPVLYWRDNLAKASNNKGFRTCLMRWVKHYDWTSDPLVTGDGAEITKQHIVDGIDAALARIPQEGSHTSKFWKKDFYVLEGKEAEIALEPCAVTKEIVKCIRIEAGLLKKKPVAAVGDKPFREWSEAEHKLHWLVWIFVTWPFLKSGLDVWDKKAAMPLLNA